MSSMSLPAVPAGQALAGANLTSYLTSMVQDAVGKKKPAMVYFYTQAKDSRARSSRQATECEAVERLVFAGRDPKLGVAARLFACSKVDVTRVEPRANPVFNTMTAPIVLVTTSSGKVVALVSGRITAAKLLTAMMEALKLSGVDGAKVLAHGEWYLKEIQRLENERAKLKRAAEGDEAKRGAVQADLAKVERELAEINSKFKDLFD